jgi:hypothetical protein
MPPVRALTGTALRPGPLFANALLAVFIIVTIGISVKSSAALSIMSRRFRSPALCSSQQSPADHGDGEAAEFEGVALIALYVVFGAFALADRFPRVFGQQQARRKNDVRAFSAFIPGNGRPQ